MNKKIHSPTLAETALGLRHENPMARMMAGFTGFAVVATLILATAIPVKADRPAQTSAMAIDAAPPLTCQLN